MVGDTNVTWAAPLPPGTLMQKVELIALSKALKFGANKKFDIHMDSRCAKAKRYMPRDRTSHIRGNKQEILDPSYLLMKPAIVSIIHCPEYQKGRNSVAPKQ